MQNSTQWWLVSLLGIAMLVCGGCGSSRTAVIEPATSEYQTSLLRLVPEGADTVVVTDEQRRELVSAFEERVYRARAFQKGENGLTASYRFSAGDPGSRSLRFWVGLWAGKGTITVDVEWRNASGEVCARTQHTSVVTGGGFGGSWNEAFENGGIDMGKFAITTFLER